MNYGELVYSGDMAVAKTIKTPIGVLYRKHSDGRGSNLVDLNECITGCTTMLDCLRYECRVNRNLTDKHQIHFILDETGENAIRLCVEQGSFISVAKLLRDTPSIVAHSGFIKTLVDDLLAFTAYLHSHQIYHLCFSPDNVFVRKGDYNVMLLSHGSFYINAISPKVFYEGYEEYIAPEVMNGEAADARSDVYSLGKFFSYLFAVAENPYTYNKVIRKAIHNIPEDRYNSVEDMVEDIKKAGMRKSIFINSAIAAGIALFIVGLYFLLMPSSDSTVGFESISQTTPETIYNPVSDSMETDTTEEPDTGSFMSVERQQKMKEYEEKSEQIFRKRYSREAERILSKIYNKDYMGSNEKKFMAASQPTIDELVAAQEELASQSHISKIRSQRIATEIIEEITERKKKELPVYGIQK